MAVQNYSTSDQFSVSQWERGMNIETLKKVSWSGFAGKGEDSLIQVRDELSSSAGDTVKYGLTMQLTGAPKQGDETLEGNERSLTQHQDSMKIDLIREGYANNSAMGQQRTNFDVRETGRRVLQPYFSQVFDQWFFNQLGGAVHETSTSLTGNNAVTEYDANHRLIMDSANNTNDQDLDSGDPFTIDMVDKAVEKAQAGDKAIRPAKVMGRDSYVLFLHPYQVTSLRGTSSAWFTFWQNAAAGGMIEGNPIVRGFLGYWNDVLIVSSSRVPTGANSSTEAEISTVRRAIFAGAQAAYMAFGRKGGNPNRFQWIEKTRDYDLIEGIAVQAVAGLKRPIFDSESLNSFTISSYAVASA